MSSIGAPPAVTLALLHALVIMAMSMSTLVAGASLRRLRLVEE